MLGSTIYIRRGCALGVPTNFSEFIFFLLYFFGFNMDMYMVMGWRNRLKSHRLELGWSNSSTTPIGKSNTYKYITKHVDLHWTYLTYFVYLIKYSFNTYTYKYITKLRMKHETKLITKLETSRFTLFELFCLFD
jgi:hypothetical protein